MFTMVLKILLKCKNTYIIRSNGLNSIISCLQCTVASKMIILTESVRDAADLFLSLKYPPIFFICNTPCTLAQHMTLRDRSVTDEIFGDWNGCFEKPNLSKEPTKVCINDKVLSNLIILALQSLKTVLLW